MSRRNVFNLPDALMILCLGIMVGWLCAILMGCERFEESNASEIKDSGTSDSMVLSQTESSQAIKETGPSVRRDSHDSVREPLESSIRESGSPTNDGGIVDAGAGESTTPQSDATPITTEASQDSGPLYCRDCPPVFGRPPCCSAYLRCGYITTLGQCTDGHL